MILRNTFSKLKHYKLHCPICEQDYEIFSERKLLYEYKNVMCHACITRVKEKIEKHLADKNFIVEQDQINTWKNTTTSKNKPRTKHKLNCKYTKHFKRRIKQRFGVYEKDIPSLLKRVIDYGVISFSKKKAFGVTYRLAYRIFYKAGVYVYNVITGSFVTCYKDKAVESIQQKDTLLSKVTRAKSIILADLHDGKNLSVYLINDYNALLEKLRKSKDKKDLKYFGKR